MKLKLNEEMAKKKEELLKKCSYKNSFHYTISKYDFDSILWIQNKTKRG